MNVGDILEELVGYYSYESGATDSGVKDDRRRDELAKMWRTCLEADNYRHKEALWFREYWLSDERIEQGYSVECVVRFFHWLEDLP